MIADTHFLFYFCVFNLFPIISTYIHLFLISFSHFLFLTMNKCIILFELQMSRLSSFLFYILKHPFNKRMKSVNL
jgi:hypothetical protein